MGFKILHHPFQGMEKVDLLDLLKRICTLIRLRLLRWQSSSAISGLIPVRVV